MKGAEEKKRILTFARNMEYKKNLDGGYQGLSTHDDRTKFEIRINDSALSPVCYFFGKFFARPLSFTPHHCLSSYKFLFRQVFMVAWWSCGEIRWLKEGETPFLRYPWKLENIRWRKAELAVASANDLLGSLFLAICQSTSYFVRFCSLLTRSLNAPNEEKKMFGAVKEKS